MKTKNLIEGLQILLKHYEDPDGYHVDSEHEGIVAQATPGAMPSEEVERLIELGWFQSCAETGRSGGDNFTCEYYLASADWRAFL